MNFVPQSSRFQTTVSRILKRRVAIDPLTFTALAFLLEFGAVVAISVVTGVVYHLAAYEASGDISAYLAVGVFGAAVYAVANTARGDYRLGNFLGGRVPIPPHLDPLARHVPVPAGGRLPGADERDLFARLDRAVLRLRPAAAGAASPPADAKRRRWPAAMASCRKEEFSSSAPNRASAAFIAALPAFAVRRRSRGLLLPAAAARPPQRRRRRGADA